MTSPIALLLLMFATPSFAASLTGRVTDTTGAPLPGVTIEVSPFGGSTAVTTTDADGRYSMSVSALRCDVAFRLSGFVSAIRTNVAVENETVVDAQLAVSSSAQIVVTGDRIGDDSAAAGVVTADQLRSRPSQRAGSILETVPGLIVSQHSGEGKANQYYLRGFNLDHGTDFAITVAGAPVNLPAHAHGQGYADANFLIPELIGGVQYRKGPYFAEQGDFASAGAVNVEYVNALDRGIALIDGGGFGYRRLLVADSPSLGAGTLLYAFEAAHNDGPWTNPDRYRKLNGVLRYTRGDQQNGFSLTGIASQGRWSSTDQVPLRAIESSAISRFGAVDPSGAGETHRYTGAFAWQRTGASSMTKVDASLTGYALDLFSNFTYFLDDPVNGDQFRQSDRRTIATVNASQRRLSAIGDHAMETVTGVQLRRDDIPRVALMRTRERQTLDTVRDDRVAQTSVALFWQSTIEWTPTLKTITGLRGDSYRFEVAGSSRRDAALASPKLTIVAGPWRNTELYANAGFGFHSNDPRGTTTALARTKGAEAGIRTRALPNVQTTISLWTLDSASELVFVGDAGTTEAKRPARRSGVEWSMLADPLSWLTVDAELNWSRARFTSADPSGDHVPGSPERVIAAGIALHPTGPLSGALRLRYFGSRPLLEDNSVRSASSTLVEARLAYELDRSYRVVLDVFNVFDTRAADVDYFYTSRLPGEDAAGVAGIHQHPVEPRSIRIGLALAF